MDSKILLNAWTASNGNPRPMFVCIQQVGSMVELILRDEQKDPLTPNAEISITMNVWTLDKLADTMREAAKTFNATPKPEESPATVEQQPQ